MRFNRFCAAFTLVSLFAALPAQGEEKRYGFGRTPTSAEIAAFDIDVRPDGQGLPPGHGSVPEGAGIFATKCASCHGEKGELAQPSGNLLAGGQGTLAFAKPVKTVGSYWPYATTLFDFIRRAMPFNAPQSLSNDEVYAVTAYVLSLNGIVGEDAVLDAATLPKLPCQTVTVSRLLTGNARGRSRSELVPHWQVPVHILVSYCNYLKELCVFVGFYSPETGY